MRSPIDRLSSTKPDQAYLLLLPGHAGEHVYGAEDGAANSATVASAVTGGGELHHGAHVCCCGYQGRIDGRHWLTECDRGPTREVRARAAAELRSVGADLLAPAENRCPRPPSRKDVQNH